MQIQPSSRRTGSVLAFTLVTIALVSVGVASFLLMVETQHRSVWRSISWNNAIPVAESGIEEAPTQLYYFGTNSPGNNWNLESGQTYSKRRNVGTKGRYYYVKVLLVDPPVITATGYVPVPVNTNSFLSRTVQGCIKLSSINVARGMRVFFMRNFVERVAA